MLILIFTICIDNLISSFVEWVPSALFLFLNRDVSFYLISEDFSHGVQRLYQGDYNCFQDLPSFFIFLLGHVTFSLGPDLGGGDIFLNCLSNFGVSTIWKLTLNSISTCLGGWDQIYQRWILFFSAVPPFSVISSAIPPVEIVDQTILRGHLHFVQPCGYCQYLSPETDWWSI